MDLVILDSPDSCNKFGASSKSDPFEIFAVSPYAYQTCKSQGWVCKTPDEVFPWSELNQRGDADYKRILDFISSLDSLFAEHAPKGFGDSKFSFLSQFHTLKGTWDAILIRGLPLAKLIRSGRYRRVLLFDSLPFLIHGPGLMDKPCYGLSAALANLFCKEQGLEVIPLSDHSIQGNRPSPNFPRETIVSPLKRSWEFFERRSRALKWRFERKPKLLHSLGPDIGMDLVKAWTARGLPEHDLFAYFPETSIKRRGRSLESWAKDFYFKIVGMIQDQRAFSVEGFDASSALLPTLEIVLKAEVVDTLAFEEYAREQINTKSLRILTGGMTGRNWIVGRLASEIGCPVFTTHFSGFLGYCALPLHERYDFSNADFFLAGGRDVGETLESPPDFVDWRPQEKRAIPKGFSIPWFRKSLNQSVKQETEGLPRRVLFVLSAFHGDNRYLGHIFSEEIEFYQLHCQLMDLSRRFPNIEFLVKLAPEWRYPQSKNPLMETVRTSGLEFSNLRFLDPEMRLSEVMTDIDLFVVDNPSTVFVETLATGRPVVALFDMRNLIVHPSAQEVLERIGTICFEFKSFIPHLEKVLSGAVRKNFEAQQEFVERFLIGSACENGVYEIVKFVEEAESTVSRGSSESIPAQ